MNRMVVWGLVMALTIGIVACDRSTGLGNVNDAGPPVDAADGGGQPDAENGDGGGQLDADTGDGGVTGPCDPAALGTSNLGCAFWAVDLDNEYLDSFQPPAEAASAQIAVLIANPQSVAVNVEVFQNTAAVGDPVVVELVTTATVAAGAQARIDLPQREVDGSMGQNGTFVSNSGSGTFVSSHGYRILTDGPVAVFQFNPIEDASSNDAALLLPEHVLGSSYTVIGWPTANPCGSVAMPMESIPDHTSVTIVGVHPNTQVIVNVTHPVMASGGESGLLIPETAVGDQIVVTLGPYDVLNLESLQPSPASPMDCQTLADQDGDFTGSRIIASAPVAVFSAAERGSGLGGATPPSPPGTDECCTDHLEEQLAPDTALGWQFAVGRSPIRSGEAGYQEPDVFRIVATANDTVVSTSLPGPFDQFTLQAGESALFWTFDGFTIQVQGGAVALGQYLISAGNVPSSSLGDPAWVAIGPVAQMLSNQLVAMAPVFTDNFLVLTYPTGTAISLDGVSIGPTTTDCDQAAVGDLGGVSYEQLTCRVTPQIHEVTADHPLSVTVFGYGNLSSFAYSGGSGVAPINP
jgi:IgGFc binding protein